MTLAVLTYLVLAHSRAQADRPAVDEAWLASPALNLLATGSMHTTILESKGTFFEGLDRYTYWILPAYPIVLAGWFSICGPGLGTMRLMSVLFGCLLIVTAHVIVGRLFPCRWCATLTAWFVALDVTVIRAGATGRMDVMGAAFGCGALAIYLSIRSNAPGTAFVAGHCLAAAAAFTHPNGLLYPAALLLVAVRWDRASLQWPPILLSALPYLLCAAAWGAYLVADFPLFVQQFGGNAANRLTGATDPLGALWREIDMRYLGGDQRLLRAGMLLPYIVGLAAALAYAPLRRHSGMRMLLSILALFFVYHWLFEAVKLHYYAVHLAPLWMATFAVAVAQLWIDYPRGRNVIVVVTAALTTIQLAGTAYTIRRNSYERVYLPVVDAVRSHACPGDLVMGSAELAFALGFDAQLLDDVRLGYHTGRSPDVVVLDRRYKDTFVNGFQAKEPDVFRHVRGVLGARERIFSVADYEIYVRRSHLRRSRRCP